jgi:large subunit ribosomal protein L17
MVHERIVTTYHKALELRPWIEKLINMARKEDKTAGHRYINSVLFTTASMKKLTREIAPRMDDLEIKAGFTRIEPIGQRKPDKAKMALIELIGNPISMWEKQQDLEAAEEFGKPTYWDWELKILRQE